MILLLNDATPGRSWQVQLSLDFSRKQWAVRDGDAGWARVAQLGSGAFEAGNELSLFDRAGVADPARRTLIVISGAPQRDADLARRSGSGRIVQPRDPALKGAAVSWQLEGPMLAGVRARGIDLCTRNLPPNGIQEPPNCVEGRARAASPTNASGHRATGCGGFAGWYFNELYKAGFSIPVDRVRKTFYWTPPGASEKKKETVDMYLTGPTFGHREIVKDLQKRHSRTVYIDFAPNSERRPRPGDVYIIRRKDGVMRHVGVFVDAEGNSWRTADGGQGQTGYGVGFNKRQFEPAAGSISGGVEPGYIDGWIDLEELVSMGADN